MQAHTPAEPRLPKCPQRLQVTAPITLVEAYLGGTTTVTFERAMGCTACRG